MSPRRALAAALAAVALSTAACSTVPTSSPTVPITQVPARGEPDIGIEPSSPEEGAPPDEIVRGFIDAAASTGRGHPVAREFLTGEAADSWADDTGLRIIGTDYATVTGSGGVVTLTATLIGAVDQRGVFTVSGEMLTEEYRLEEVDGEWRIAGPPEGLIILEPDFERLYDEVDVFFVDPTLTRLVPDPRYLISGEAQPTALVDRLFGGASPALRPGVVNHLGDDLSLRRPVTVDGDTATVDFAGLPDDAAEMTPALFSQLVWTLEQVGIRRVLVLVDGERVQIDGVPAEQTTDDWASFDPDAVPVDGVGHYVDGGLLRTVDGEPVPGPAGEGEYRLRSAAVAADARTGGLSFLVGVVPGADGTSSLLAGPYGEALAPVLSGESFTAPSVAATRTEAWVVRGGSDVVRIPSGGQPRDVLAPTLPDLGEASVLELSPDGVRAAVVVERPNGPRLFVGTVVRDEESAVALRDLREVAPSLAEVVDVAWRDSGTLLVLAGDAAEGEVEPYVVGVDGWGLDGVSMAGLPAQPASIAAAPTRQPLVSADREIWQLTGSIWSTLIAGQEPLPGTAPFFPL